MKNKEGGECCAERGNGDATDDGGKLDDGRGMEAEHSSVRDREQLGSNHEGTEEEEGVVPESETAGVDNPQGEDAVAPESETAGVDNAQTNDTGRSCGDGCVSGNNVADGSSAGPVLTREISRGGVGKRVGYNYRMPAIYGDFLRELLLKDPKLDRKEARTTMINAMGLTMSGLQTCFHPRNRSVVDLRV